MTCERAIELFAWSNRPWFQAGPCGVEVFSNLLAVFRGFVSNSQRFVSLRSGFSPVRDAIEAPADRNEPPQHEPVPEASHEARSTDSVSAHPSPQTAAH